MNIIRTDNKIRIRTWIISLFSVAGLYFAIFNHKIALIVLAFNIVSLLLLRNEEIFSLLFFLLPFAFVYKYNPQSTSLFTYFSIIAVLYLLLKNISKVKCNNITFCSLCFFAIYSLPGSLSNYTGYIKIVFAFFMAFVFIQVVNKKSFPSIITSLSLGGIISGIIGMNKSSVPQLKAYFSDLNMEYINGEKTERFSALYLDPNYFSIFILICLFALFLFAYAKQINKTKAIVLAVPLAIFGCMTYSRMFYACAAIMMLMIFLILLKENKHKSLTIFSIIIVAGILLYVLNNYGFLEGILLRFERDDVSGGRTHIWKMYLEYILSSPKTLLLGEGIGADFYNNVGPHNSYVESVYFLGIFGSIIYLILIASILNQKVYLRKRKIINYLPVIVFMFSIGTLGTLFMYDFIYFILVLWMILNTDFSIKHKEILADEFD